MVKYVQAYDDVWVRIVRRKFREQCCDCGLVHQLDFRTREGYLEVRARRLPRATAAVRRHFKFTPDRD